jgi:hypothetical protein
MGYKIYVYLMSDLYARLDCDTEHYLAFAKVRERFSASKRATCKFDMERLNLKKLNEVEGKEEYQFDVSKRLADLENLNYCMDISRAWEIIPEN